MKKLLAILFALFVSFSATACTIVAPTNEFTLTELAAYDGTNGAKAYVAVNGVVYDITNEDAWVDGVHQGMHLAGTDATAIFAESPHSQSLLDELTKVGVIVEESEANASSSSTLPVFTLTDLAQYTGAAGSTAYIAVDGVVYDVTSEFSNGAHQGLQLGGTDATAVFAQSPHSPSWLSQLTVVGTLSNGTSTSTTPTGTPTYLPVFTLTQLAQYTGANETTAYTAVNGVVYNITSFFTNGIHQGFQLGGVDSTAIFESSPHALSWLNQLPKVGSLEGAALVENTGSTTPTYNNGTDDDEHEDDEWDDEWDDDFTLSELPQAIQDYIQANYPTAVIDEIEREDNYYEVEFTNDVELYFTLDGQFVHSEIDD